MSYNNDFNEYMLFSRAIIIALFIKFSKGKWSEDENYNKWSPINIGKYLHCDIFSKPSDIIPIYNSLIEFELIEGYTINIAPKIGIQDKITSTFITKNNLQKGYEFSYKIDGGDYDVEFLTEKEDLQKLDGIIEEYIEKWKGFKFEFYIGRFVSIEKQESLFMNKISELKKNFDTEIVPVFRNDIGDKHDFDGFQEYNIDLLGLILYFNSLNNIILSDIELGKSVGYKIKVKEEVHINTNEDQIYIGNNIFYLPTSLKIQFPEETISLIEKKNKQKMFVLTLLGKIGEKCDHTDFVESFRKYGYKIELKEDDDISDYLNDIYNSIRNKNSKLYPLSKFIIVLRGTGYRLK